jgi:L-aspartate oxidase
MISTGDGLAIAYRAGALIKDMEFIQFHPTTLFAPGAPPFLLSEAMRGEGALLKNIRGERFMTEYHEMLELAPRDTVTRAIVSEMIKTDTNHVFLDLRHLDKDFAKNRFPLIYKTCLQYDIDITEEMIPVSPAAHYIMGGVYTSLHGETTIKGLFAAGEVACTGIHGANRLASNSLLEGLVFGARTGKKAVEYAGRIQERKAAKNPDSLRTDNARIAKDFDLEKTRSILRQIIWKKAGIIRCSKSLSEAAKWLKHKEHILETPLINRRMFELKNMLTTANLIVGSALLRKGSVGAHYRSDFTEKGKSWQKHTACIAGKDAFWTD